MLKQSFICFILIFSLVPLGQFPAATDGISLDTYSKYFDKEIVIGFDNFQALQHLGDLRPNRVFSSIPAITTIATRSTLSLLSKMPGITYIESSPKLYPLLDYSMKQIGIAQSFWNANITGGLDKSIAIIDTGIDPTHSAFRGRIIASYNAVNGNATAPLDNHGHGTHVTGIAAGNLVFQSGFVETSRGALPPQCANSQCLLSLSFSLVDVPEETTVSLDLDWGSKGSDNPGSEAGIFIFDPQTNKLACNTCHLTSTSGTLVANRTLHAGSYFVAVSNEASGQGQPYEFTISYKRTSDGPTKLRGGAYSANIVAVKALDGTEGGELGNFDKAVTWIIDNRMKYNITVVNLSLGLNQSSNALNEMITNLFDHGIVPVVAAGNSGISSKGVFSPASAPESIAVGSVNYVNEIAYYTNIGDAKVNDQVVKPDILAPGGSLATTAAGFRTTYEPGFGRITGPDANIGYNLAIDDSVSYQGTSMAAPHIASLALLVSSNMDWDWNSRTTAVKVKRMILAGTFEVANIGIGRELAPNEKATSPTLDRSTKDFQEGWGASDARAVFDEMQSKIDIGFSSSIEFNLQDPQMRKTKIYPITLKAGVNYAFKIDVPSIYDLDIKVISANEGPLVGGKDIGELKILTHSSKGKGINEGIGIQVDKTQDAYLVITAVEGKGKVQTTLDVLVDDNLPQIDIINPMEGTKQKLPFEVKFDSNYNQVDLTIDGTSYGLISNGYKIDGLSSGEHILELSATSDIGITIHQSVTFSIPQKSSSEKAPSILSTISLSVLIIFVLMRRFNKFKT